MRLTWLALAFALAAPPAAAQSFYQGEIRYLSGGMSAHAIAVMREAADEYNLRLEFAAGAPARYVPATRVLVQDRRGKTVLDLRDAGPLVYVDLPRGRYVVRATHRGVMRTRVVVVGEYSGMSALFSWPETPALSRG